MLRRWAKYQNDAGTVTVIRRMAGEHMHILVNDLIKKFNSVDKILIYGAGNYANLIYPVLKQEGMYEKIASFVVTNAAKVSEIDGIPVKSFRELNETDHKMYGVLVAVSRAYEQDIVENLQEQGFAHIWRLTDYILSEGEYFAELTKEQSDEQFLSFILNKMNREQQVSMKETLSKREEWGTDIRTILFISGDLTPRTIKIIKALIKKNINIILLLYGHVNELVKQCLPYDSIKIYECGSIVDVFYWAIMYKPLVYYCEPDSGDYSAIEIMVRHKNIFGKIVFGPYDILNDGYANISERQKLSERYSLENADGIVWRWYSKEFLEEMKGFVFGGKSIQLLDYCNGYYRDNVGKSHSDMNVLRLCFVSGGMYGMFDEDVNQNDVHYNKMAKVNDVMKKLGKRDDCIFHIYIGKVNEKEKNKADILSKEYPNFKLFHGIEYDELISKISSYDYGCYWCTDGEEMPLLEADDQGVTGSNYMNSIPNRYFDYIDAGLPIIAEIPWKICSYLNKLGVLVKMNLSNLDIDFLKEAKTRYRENVKNVQEKLLMDNHIDELIDFFHEL